MATEYWHGWVVFSTMLRSVVCVTGDKTAAWSDRDYIMCRIRIPLPPELQVEEIEAELEESKDGV
jgi:hypothetical protein